MKERVKNYCTGCAGFTNHSILFSKDIIGDDEDFQWDRKYQTVECDGCSTIAFREDYGDESLVNYDEDHTPHYYREIINYPYALQGHRSSFVDAYLPIRIRDAYRETISAFKSKCKMLTGIGFRVVIEAICLELDIKGKDLKQKIENLVKNKHITDSEGNRLHSIRFLGNDSVHEMQKPSEAKLYIVLRIVENLLWNLYIADYEMESLETIIHEYDDFVQLLRRKAARKYSEGFSVEFSLKSVLAKDVRRFSDVNLLEFEKKIIQDIEDGKIKFLFLVNNKQAGKLQSIQHYKVTEGHDFQ